MYAILQHGGHQYRVSAGDRLLVNRLDAQVGDVVALGPVLLTSADGKTEADGGKLDGVRVSATVLAHRRGRKLRILKYKAKKRYRRTMGFRADLTELRIEEVLRKGEEPKQTTTEKTEKKPASKPKTAAKLATATPAAKTEAAEEPVAETEETAAETPAPKARRKTSAKSESEADAAEQEKSDGA